MSKQQWVYAKDKLPNDFESVITQLFDGEIILNSIKHRNHPDASGKLTKIREWTNRNVNVVCWIAIPNPPNATKPD